MNKDEFIGKLYMIYYGEVNAIADILDIYDDLHHKLEEKEQEIRLDQTKKIFKVLAETIKNGSISYRNLIDDKLGFTGHYNDLIDGLTITNTIVDSEEKDNKEHTKFRNKCRKCTNYDSKLSHAIARARKKDLLDMEVK